MVPGQEEFRGERQGLEDQFRVAGGVNAHRPSEASADSLLRGSFAAKFLSKFLRFYLLLVDVCEDDVPFHEGELEVEEIRSHTTQIRLRIRGRALEKGVDALCFWNVDDSRHGEVSLEKPISKNVDGEVVNHRAVIAHLNQQSRAEFTAWSGGIVTQEGVVGEDLPDGRELHVH